MGVQTFCVRWRSDVAKMRRAPENATFTQKFAMSVTPDWIELQRFYFCLALEKDERGVLLGVDKWLDGRGGAGEC